MMKSYRDHHICVSLLCVTRTLEKKETADRNTDTNNSNKHKPQAIYSHYSNYLLFATVHYWFDLLLIAMATNLVLKQLHVIRKSIFNLRTFGHKILLIVCLQQTHY